MNRRCIDKITIKIPLSTFLDMKARVDKYKAQVGTIKQNRVIYLNFKQKYDYVTYSKYLEMLAKYNTFIAINGRQPNYITTTNSSTPTKTTDCYKNPRWYSGTQMKQDLLWYCGCNSLQQILYELTGNYYAESSIAKLAGTTRRGTDPVEIVRVLKLVLSHAGLKVKRCEWIYKDDISWEEIGEIIQNPKQSVCIHSKYRDKWGHYEIPVALCLSNKILTIANSLSGGYIEKRSFSTQERYIREQAGRSILIVEVE